MSATWIVEAVDVVEDRHLSLPAGVPRVSPDQLCFDRFEERLNRSVVIAIAFSTLRYFEPVLAQDLSIVVRTVLAATIRVLDAALG